MTDLEKQIKRLANLRDYHLVDVEVTGQMRDDVSAVLSELYRLRIENAQLLAMRENMISLIANTGGYPR